jgi:predicted RNA-binding protein YlqC (UPF0109 family)
VSDADAVIIDTSADDEGLIFTVNVAPDDMGRVIGKKGRIISALRTVVRAAAGDTGVNVEIAETL